MSKIKINLLAGIFCFGLPVLVQAYQIAPNPNPSGSTITVMTLDAENFTRFENWGSLEIVDTGTLNNTMAGHLSNFGSLTNSGILNTYDMDNANELINLGTMTIGNLLVNHSGGTLTNRSGGTLTNSDDGNLVNIGNLSNEGTLNNNGGVFLEAMNNLGTLSNTGTLNNSGFMTNNRGTYAGILNNSTGGIVNNTEIMINTGIMNNNGTLNNSDRLSNRNTGIMNNNGTLNNSGGLGNSGTITGTGTYIQTAGETFNTGSFSQASIQIDGGCLRGTGTVTGNLSVGSGGCLGGPRNSPGTMTVNGDVSSGGTLIFEVAGMAAGQYDVLDINGKASFSGGTIQFNFIDSFSGVAGNYWDFLRANTITGWDNLGFSFNGLDAGLGWNFTELDKGSKRLWLTSNSVSPIPEPEIYAMLLAGLGLIGFTARRRKDISPSRVYSIRNGGAWAHVCLFAPFREVNP